MEEINFVLTTSTRQVAEYAVHVVFVDLGNDIKSLAMMKKRSVL